MMIEILGFTAAFLSTVCYVPQVLKILKTGHANDISLLMYIILTMAAILWIIYGLMTESMPVIAANIVSFLLSGTILIMKIRKG